MTCVEFASIIIRGLGLPERQGCFCRCLGKSWYAEAVARFTAWYCSRHHPTTFNPNGSITVRSCRQVARAAKLTGMEASMADNECGIPWLNLWIIHLPPDGHGPPLLSVTGRIFSPRKILIFGQRQPSNAMKWPKCCFLCWKRQIFIKDTMNYETA